jgi:hypothetical protein
MSNTTTNTNTKLPPHTERRRLTSGENFPPNDNARREKERKEANCQRCHFPFKTQYSVIKDEEGNRTVVRAQKNRAHYCKDCADERKAELERYDARPKTEKPKAAKKTEKAKAAKPKPKPSGRRARPRRSDPISAATADPF